MKPAPPPMPPPRSPRPLLRPLRKRIPHPSLRFAQQQAAPNRQAVAHLTGAARPLCHPGARAGVRGRCGVVRRPNSAAGALGSAPRLLAPPPGGVSRSLTQCIAQGVVYGSAQHRVTRSVGLLQESRRRRMGQRAGPTGYGPKGSKRAGFKRQQGSKRAGISDQEAAEEISRRSLLPASRRRRCGRPRRET